MGPIKAALIATLVLTAARGWAILAETAQPRDDYMTKESKTGEEQAKKPSPPPDEELVITPAGPVLKKNVHQVAPNQAVRRNQDGTYTIVPKTDPQ
jgi:hypothetical protein